MTAAGAAAATITAAAAAAAATITAAASEISYSLGSCIEKKEKQINRKYEQM